MTVFAYWFLLSVAVFVIVPTIGHFANRFLKIEK